MPSPGAPAPPRLPIEDSYFELLADTLENLDLPARGQFLQRYFRAIAHLDLRETQSVEIWDEMLSRRRELTDLLGRPVALKTALTDVLTTSGLLRVPILIEYDELKRLESLGYTFDGADASFELLMLRTLGFARDHFRFVSFRVFDDKWHEDHTPFSEATVVIEGPDGVRTRNSATGNGPVNALDSALRGALVPYYPALETMHLADYKVRVLDNGAGTAARVRVLIESTDGKRRWGTVGLSSNVVEASWQALVDSVEYKLHKDNVKPRAKPASKSNGARPRSKAPENSHAAHPKV